MVTVDLVPGADLAVVLGARGCLTRSEAARLLDDVGSALARPSVGRVLIERPAKNARVTIFSARPGVVIGKKGEEIENLRSALQKIMGVPVHISIEEIRKPELSAQLIADSITQQLEKRIMFQIGRAHV